jgi:CMP-N-acetylneuraminic acid synthetase
MNVSAFIPAKMTSRRLPGKNMKPFNGKPLLHYSIRAAQKTPSIQSIIVSSEDSGPLDVARSYGVTAFERPKNLSGAETLIAEVMQFHYTSMESMPDIVVLLQPTHPLRFPEELERSIQAFQASDCDCMFAVAEEDVLLGTISNGRYIPEFPMPRDKNREPVRYRNTGNFYLFRPERTFLAGLPFGRVFGAYPLASPELEVDIDYPEQFVLAERILRAYQDRFTDIIT